MPPKSRDGDVIFSFSGKWVAWAHTIVAYCAFVGALIVGLQLHYYKIVENEYYGYPQEWFPSVSSTIGDRYPERSVFQIFIAITSGPRFALVFLFYLLTAKKDSVLPQFILGVGVFRTLTCGGWTYITSTDDHGWHDVFMISYLVATLPWTVGCIALSPKANPNAIKWRKRLATAFFSTLIPLIYFFIQHKIHRVPGAYTTYAFFEWALILLDVGFDAVTALDFEGFELIVKDVQGASRGNSEQVSDAVLEKRKNEALAQVAGAGFSVGGALDAISDVYIGFVFWSMLTSLGLTVWYFPLWHMGISGYEAAIVCTTTPFLLCNRNLRPLLVRNLRFIHLLSLLGLVAYLVKSPELRLLTVSLGVGSACLAWSTAFYAERNSPARLEAKALAWCIGLILSSLSKFANYTNNPIWPIVNADNGGWNKLGLALALIAVLYSSRRTSIDAGGASHYNSRTGSPTLAGLGFGGLLFGLHSLLSDSSTMISWVWEGYPVRGPIPANGTVTLLFMGLGLVYYLSVPEGTSSARGSYGLFAVGALLLTYFSHWTGYLGALSLAFGGLCLSPTIIASAVRNGPLAFGVGFSLYNVLVFAHVWIVAYAFVPGGPLMREHTDWVMAATVLSVGAGATIALTGSSRVQRKPRSVSANRLKSPYVWILYIIELLAFAVAYLRFPTNDYVPYHKEDKVITAGIWTVHFSLDNDMWSSERRMRDLIKEMELDVIGLLESDLQRIIMGNRDTTQYIAEDLGMYVDAGPGPNKHTWGAALLSKFPILNSTHHLLPSPVGELAPAIHATLDAYGELVDVVVFHSGQEEDPEDRRLQSLYLADLMKSSPRPLILLSYLVVKPLEGNYHTYVGEKSGMRDIDKSDWDRWCEYILYKGLKRSGYARVSRGTITDTELQVGKFIVGQPESSDEQISVADVPTGQRFPDIFRAPGRRGHAYHVFDEPRYYQ